MKLLSLIAACFAFIAVSAADFSVELTKQTETAAPGQPIELELDLKCPEGYRPGAWILTAFRDGVPEEFPKALDLEKKFSKAKRPEWSYCNIFVRWFAKNDNTMQKKLSFKTTDKWPVGDYRFSVQVLFRKKGAKDKYISTKLLFTLEKPAENSETAETKPEENK